MKSILIVDDSEIIRNIIAQTLRTNNYNDILMAKDGLEALSVIKEHLGQIGMYIFDVNMPNMDGLTLLAEVRKIDTKTPVIMLTTETEKEKIMQAKDLGATGWIIKPCEGEKFIKVVDMYFKE